MSGKKKNVITLLSLCVVLAVCLVLYFVLPGVTSGTEDGGTSDTAEDGVDTDSEGSITVDTIAEEKIDTVTVSKAGKKVWTLKHKKDSWQLTGLQAAPVDSDTVTAILGNLEPVTATQRFTAESEDLSAYGLDEPALTVDVATNDGENYQYQIGSEVPKSDMGYYGKSAGSDEIFCINTAFVTAFDVSEISLVKMDELPDIEADYMTYIQVDNKSAKDFEAKLVSDKEKVDFYSNWNITAPYAKPLATSSSDWSTVLGYFSALTYEEMVAFQCQNLKKYGLEEPSSVITVKYYQAKEGYTPTATATPSTTVSSTSSSDESYIIPEEMREYKTLQLCVGKKKGESYYVCEKGKKDVYMMSASSLENITKLDAYTNMDHCVYSVLATSIKGYDVTYGDTTLKVTRKSVKKDDSENSEATATPTATATESGTAVSNDTDSSQKNIWTLNGKTISEDDENDFLTPYSQAYLLEYSEKADDDVKPKSSKPVLTIVYHEDNRDVTVKYLPYDGINFYRVEKNGMDYFLVDKLAVDDVIEKFKGIEKLAE